MLAISNALVHGKPTPSESERCEWVQRYVEEFQAANRILRNNVTVGFHYHGTSQILNKIVISVDAACDMKRNLYGIGIMVRTPNGKANVAMHNQFPYLSSPLCAEARAVLEGMRLAQRMEFSKVDIYSDSLGLVSMIEGSVDESAEAFALLWDIKLLRQFFKSIRFFHINRSYNNIAHKLARLGLDSEPMLWVHDIPYWIQNLVSLEKPLFVISEGSSSSSN